MPEYGVNITAQSFPDYDEWSPLDNYWGCTDWMIWYNRLEEFYGSEEARMRWKSAWEQQRVGAGTWDCLYNEQFREFVDDNDLGLENVVADVVTGAGDTISGLASGFGWVGRNIGWILPVALVVGGGAYIYFQVNKGKALKGLL